MSSVRIAIAGVGNCASALLQGIAYYRTRALAEPQATQLGLMHSRIGAWGPGDIQVAAAFDVDRRKVGRPLEQAIFAPPNCARVFEPNLEPCDVVVSMGPPLDGIAPHMACEEGFLAADHPAIDVAERLRQTQAEVLVCYMPVGAEEAVRHYAEAALQAGAAFVNCVPVPIASDPLWCERFRTAGLPLLGDDIKSQVGATIVHRVLARLFEDRGVRLERTYQLNVGGNSDFRNMLDRGRLGFKKRSKTEAVQSQLRAPMESGDIHVGPSDYVSWQGDNKVAFIRLEGRGFGGLPIEAELRLSVEDSPNSAGVVIDCIRCARLALEQGLAGPLEAPCAYYMKSPPAQMTESLAYERTEAFLSSARIAGAKSI